MSDCGRCNCQILGEHYHDEIELRDCIAALEAEMTRLENEVATANTEAATWRMKESQAKSHCAVACAQLREREAEVDRLLRLDQSTQESHAQQLETVRMERGDLIDKVHRLEADNARLTAELADSEQRRCAAGDSAVTWQREAARLRKALDAYSEDEILHPRQADQHAPTVSTDSSTVSKREDCPVCGHRAEVVGSPLPDRPDQPAPEGQLGFVEDQPITPMPEYCTQWPCCTAKEKLENQNGFMVCPSCSASYGEAAAPEARDEGELKANSPCLCKKPLADHICPERVAELVAALEWYAKRENFRGDPSSAAMDDGHRARVALTHWEERTCAAPRA